MTRVTLGPAGFMLIVHDLTFDNYVTKHLGNQFAKVLEVAYWLRVWWMPPFFIYLLVAIRMQCVRKKNKKLAMKRFLDRKATKFSSEKNNVNNCIICMEDFTDSHNIVTLECNEKHVFDLNCLQ